MRVLSLDVGSKKTGISISSSDRSLIFPLKPLFLDKFQGNYFFNKLQEHLKEYWDSIDTVIIGDPEYIDYESKMSDYIDQIYRIFKTKTNWKVLCISEINSTVDSRLLLKKLNFPKKKLRENIDSYAALILLNDFLTLNNQEHIVSF